MRPLGLIVILPIMFGLLAVMARATQNHRELDLRDGRSPAPRSDLSERRGERQSL